MRFSFSPVKSTQGAPHTLKRRHYPIDDGRKEWKVLQVARVCLRDHQLINHGRDDSGRPRACRTRPDPLVPCHWGGSGRPDGLPVAWGYRDSFLYLDYRL